MGDAPTIQAGIDSAASGDTVLALPGEYFENINFRGKAILVQGSGRDVTTINGTDQGSCVTFDHGEGLNSILKSFTIKKGRGTFLVGTYWGGGVFAFGAAPKIIDNIIELNDASSTSGGFQGRGGGMYFAHDGPQISPWVEDNIIRFNKAGGNGGGIACSGSVVPIIKRNVVFGNEAVGGDGGGIWLFTSGTGCLIEENVVDHNLAGDHGGGIFVDGEGIDPSYEILGNLISNNSAFFRSFLDAGGGGLFLTAASVWLHHNTIVKNGSLGVTESGGGVAVSNALSMLIEQNIIALSNDGGGILCFGPGSPGLIRNNLAWQNIESDGSGGCSNWTQINGNIVANPLFCDDGSDNYYLSQNSPGLSHSAGPLGAFPSPGCGPVFVQHSSWGALKARYKVTQ